MIAGMLSIQNAPRDYESLLLLKPGQRFRLGSQIHLFPDDAAGQVFMSLPPDQQTRTLVDGFAHYDAQHGGPPAGVAPAPSNGQSAPAGPVFGQPTMPQGAPQMPPQQPQAPQMPPQFQQPQAGPPPMPAAVAPPQPAFSAPQQAQAPQQVPQMGAPQGMPPMPAMPPMSGPQMPQQAQQAPPQQPQPPQMPPQQPVPATVSAPGMPPMPAMPPMSAAQPAPQQVSPPPAPPQPPQIQRQPQTASDPTNSGSFHQQSPGSMVQVLQQITQMGAAMQKANAENLEWLEQLSENQQNTAQALSLTLRLVMYLTTQVLNTDVASLKTLLKQENEKELLDFLEAFAPKGSDA